MILDTATLLRLFPLQISGGSRSENNSQASFVTYTLCWSFLAWPSSSISFPCSKPIYIQSLQYILSILYLLEQSPSPSQSQMQLKDQKWRLILFQRQETRFF
ncbi:hypothetical protein RchiOBHm_Chr2g0157721 [Rosa chinensis]|uniref:Uncharacterized protein n=1 Tax=Rosa chinensis TaxID=74649 RepID=A0A2P6S1S6_ROSCH|nr:hypothetical protein RchiOBHm_Chr2g0157721 [Rosa chinensis]